MDQNQPLDFNQIPKQLCENVVVSFNSETFMLGMIVGSSIAPFALTPEHAKRLAKLLAKNVETFETQFRPIDEEQKIPSPIQIRDLGDTPET